MHNFELSNKIVDYLLPVIQNDIENNVEWLCQMVCTDYYSEQSLMKALNRLQSAVSLYFILIDSKDDTDDADDLPFN